MRSTKVRSRKVVVEGTFSMVVSINDDTSLDQLLKEETEWIGEPTTPNGCVLAMTCKDLKYPKK